MPRADLVDDVVSDPPRSSADNEPELWGKTSAMATQVTIRAWSEGSPKRLRAGVERALRVFSDVEGACTRFDPDSPLMRVNADPERWQRVPRLCFDAVVEAHRAYQRSRGRFDPRVLSDLVDLGYDRTLPFGGGAVSVAAIFGRRRAARPPWKPAFRDHLGELRIGPHPIDLGGIGKGLAIRWASEHLHQAGAHHLVEAGGDCYCAGRATDGQSWRVGVEDPRGGDQPVAVVALSDRACATSSVRTRNWKAGGRRVHHLIDPRTGRPGGEGLLAVTVVADDPAEAEVWAKVLFLSGTSDVSSEARRHGIAACWVDETGSLGTSTLFDRHLVWRAD